MAHLSLSLTRYPDLHNHCNEGPPDHHLTSSRAGSSDREEALELMEVYPGYEGYIENGLICLKHKVRNLEKKKLKLEEYKLRLTKGHKLNKDHVCSQSSSFKIMFISNSHCPLLFMYELHVSPHFTILQTITLTPPSPALSSDSVDVSLLPHPLAPLEAPHVAPSLPLYALRVAYTASRTANFAPGNLDQPIVFDQLHLNVGETYDTRIGRFTCPADGAYVFHFHILKLAINVPLYINLMRNEEVMVSAYANDSTPDHMTASNHAILPLFHGDQVWLRLHRGAIYGSTWKFSTFSGFLLYQD
uniref:C1q domain-containing protein n=1 Tax=Neogobius melanostomus TaxID=47308 RepID=A0A8C6T9R9_9GOBI